MFRVERKEILFLGMLDWILGKSNGQLLGHLTRDTLDNATE